MYKAALNGYAKMCNNTLNKKKHVYLYPIRSVGITYAHAKELGFKCSFNLWKSCLNQTKRNMGRNNNVTYTGH